MLLQNGIHAELCKIYNLFVHIRRHGFDGRACILKTFCDASKALTPKTGMFFKLFKLIFS